MIAAPSLLALLSFPLAAGLTVYHVYLIWVGMTTNESGKWADLREDIGEGRVWRARIEELMEEEFYFLGVGDREGQGGDCAWPVKPSWVLVRMKEPGRRPRVRRVEWGSRNGMGKRGEGLEELDGGGNAGAGGGGRVEYEEDLSWTQVRSLSEVENIYDLGFWDNLKDVFLNRE